MANSDDLAAMSLASAALAQALERHKVARDARDAPAVFASAAESVWWICAIDERLGGKKPDSPYAIARDADEFGRCIRGLRWARNQHAHQLLLTTARDDRPFFVVLADRGCCT